MIAPRELQYHTPHRDKAKQQAALKLRHLAEIDGAVDTEQTHQRQPHGNLIADNLRCSPKAAEHSILIGRGPTGKDNSIDRKTGKGEKQRIPRSIGIACIT